MLTVCCTARGTLVQPYSATVPGYGVPVEGSVTLVLTADGCASVGVPEVVPAPVDEGSPPGAQVP